MREAKKTESAGGEHSNVNSRNAGVVSPGSVSELISFVNTNQAEDGSAHERKWHTYHRKRNQLIITVLIATALVRVER